MKFEIEFNERGHFRIVHVEGENRKHGEWTRYESVARMRSMGTDYFAVSQYYSGTTLPIETVFSVTPYPTVLFLPPEEAK